MKQEKKPALGFVVTVALVVVLAVPFLYVASMGVSAFLFGFGQIEEATFDSILEPFSTVKPYLPEWAGDAFLNFELWCFFRGQELVL